MSYNPGRRNRVVVDMASDHDGSGVDLTSTDTVKAPDSDEKEQDMGDGGASSPASRCVSHVLVYLTDD